MDSRRGQSLFWRMLRDRGGATIIVFALVLVPLLSAAGGAIDFWRAYVIRSQIQSALDAAILAAASPSDMTDDERVAYAKQVFDANYDAKEFEVPATPNISVSSDRKITGTVDADLDTLFLDLIGLKSLDLGSFAEVQIASLVSGEIVLVLDYSGSMNSGGKYKSMRDAATEMIKILSEDGTNKNVKFGLVPFSEHVYGTMESDYIINEKSGGWWTNCTRDRKWSYNTQDTTPIAGIDGSKWGLECSGGGEGGGEEEEGEGGGCGGGEGEGEEGEGEEGGGGCACNPYTVCANYPKRNLVIQPLTDNHKGLISNLNSMSPYAATHISVGLSIGWHLLSPNPPWTEGVAYGTANTAKAIVLLTDGAQTTPGYGPGGSASVSNAEDNLEDLCTAIKAKDVTVVTVAFDLSSSSTKTRLQNCATSPTHFYFDVETGAELIAAFKEIAGELAGEMRLTK